MRAGIVHLVGFVWPLALSALLATTPAAAGSVHYQWTVDGKPPTTINDLHLYFQVVQVPFSFGGVLIDDDGNFTSAAGSTPDSGGNFTIDFAGATPAYGSDDNVHVAFNFTSSEDVRLVRAEWTYSGVVVGVAQGLQVHVQPTPLLSSPSSIALFAVGFAMLSAITRRRSAA